MSAPSSLSTFGADPQRPTHGDQIIVRISDIRVDGLQKKLFTDHQNVLVAITIDDKQTKETPVMKHQDSSQWAEPFSFNVQSPSTSLCFAVFRTSKWHARSPIGRLTINLNDVVKDDWHALKNEEKAVGRIAFKLTCDGTATVVTGSSAQDNAIYAESALRSALAAVETPSSTKATFGKVQHAVDGASSLSDPLQSLSLNVTTMASSIAPLGDAIKSIDRLMQFFDKMADIHPIVKVAWTLLGSVYQVLKQQTEQDNTVVQMCTTIRDMFVFAREVKSLRQLEGGLDVVKEMFQAVTDGALLIEEYFKVPFAVRAARGAIWGTMSNRISACTGKLSSLYVQFDRTVNIQSFLMIEQLHADSMNRTRRERLACLPYVEQATFDFVKKCSSGTRTELLEELLDWASATGPDDPRVLWMRGVAGMGKSTIAASFAQLLQDSERLGGSFFFSRSVADRSTSLHVFSTLASQLIVRIPRLSENILKAIEERPDVGTAAVSEQWRLLLKTPLRNTEGLQLPIVIVFDAFDECATASDILSALARDIATLPPVFKVFISSRPERELEVAIKPMGQWVRQGTLEKDASADSDIRKFILDELAEITGLFELDEDWPGREMVDGLVQKSAGLFIWAATALKFIKQGGTYGPDEPLELVLGDTLVGATMASPFADLDTLYLQVLNRAFPPSQVNEEKLSLCRGVLGAIVTVRDPLNAISLAELLSIKGRYNTSPSKVILLTVQNLKSVLAVPSGDGELIRTVHPSFIEFLTNRDRCVDDRFSIDTKVHHRFLTLRCFQLMHEGLTKDICDFGPALLNSEVKDLNVRISQKIPGSIQYACRYWADHLKEELPDGELLDSVRTFYFSDLLHWVEVLSLLDGIEGGFRSLRNANDWLQRNCTPEDTLLTIASDAQRFLQEFRFPITESAPHVYYSALPLSPRNSLIHRTYITELPPNSVRLTAGAHEQWTPCVAVLERCFGPIVCTAFSPDGSRLATGGHSSSIQLWDFPSGALRGRLDGHSESVNSVAFSPDGAYIVSGSDDATLRLWDTSSEYSNGALVKEHEAAVNSVAFSPDGKYVLSGSDDNTIRLWTFSPFGLTEHRVFIRHTDKIYSVAFSPSGKIIASASLDKSIRLWRFPEGTQLAELRGHTSSVNSVAFSTDGTKIVSGSGDETVRIWDVETGTVCGGPLSAGGVVHSVVFSPSGNMVVSGGLAPMIHVWDAMSGEPIGDGFWGHADEVFSVNFSPDGKYVASGSADTMVRLWDVDLGCRLRLKAPSPKIRKISYSADKKQLISGSSSGALQVWNSTSLSPNTESYEAHSDVVLCIASSADGSRIASGSHDQTIRLWDSVSGRPIGDALEGHTGAVWGLGYSADGTRIISASADKTLRLWDSDTGLAIGEPMIGHVDSVRCVAFSPDGAEATSGGEDCTILVWDLSSQSPTTIIATPEMHYPIVHIQYSTDGAYFLSVGWDGTLLCWDRKTRTVCLKPACTDVWSGLLVGFDQLDGWVKNTDGEIIGWVPVGYRAVNYGGSHDGRVVTHNEQGEIAILDFSSVLSS